MKKKRKITTLRASKGLNNGKKNPSWDLCGCYLRCGYYNNHRHGCADRHKKGAQATSKFPKALAKLREKAAPVIGGLLNLTAKLLSLGADAVGYRMCDFVYEIRFPKSGKNMKAQGNETVGNYTLTYMRLEYEIIESEELADGVRGTFNVGRSLGYDYMTLLKTLSWSKDSTR